MHDMNLNSWAKLSLTFELYAMNSQPEACWNSPLFGSPGSLCVQNSGLAIEKQCLNLAQATRDWFQQHKHLCRGKKSQVEMARGRLELLLADVDHTP